MVRAGVPPGGRAGRRAGRVVPAPGRPAALAPGAPPPSLSEGPPSFSAAPESAARVEGSDPGAPPPRGAGRTAAALGWASTAGGGGRVRSWACGLRQGALGGWIVHLPPLAPEDREGASDPGAPPPRRVQVESQQWGPGTGRRAGSGWTEHRERGARGCLAGLRLDVGQLGRALDRREEVAQQGSLLLLLLLRGLPISNRRPSGGPRRRRAGARPARPGARRGRCRSRLRQGTLRSLISIPWIALVALSCGAGRGSAPATRPGS